jgi:NAD-dependent SIR2 family protein deacetylase
VSVSAGTDAMAAIAEVADWIRASARLVIGSTLVVQPAALMPAITKQAGGRVVIINLSESGGDHYADLVIRGKAGRVMSLILEQYREGQ